MSSEPQYVLQLQPAFEGHPDFPLTYYAGYCLAGEPVRTQELRQAARFLEDVAKAVASGLLGTLSCTWTAVSLDDIDQKSIAAAPCEEPRGQVTFGELWGGDQFRTVDGALWTKLSVSTARRHSKESISLRERGYGYLGDPVCSFEPADAVAFVSPVAYEEISELEQLARAHGWFDQQGTRRLTAFLGDELKAAQLAGTCTPAPAGADSGTAWACYGCGYSGTDFRTLVQKGEFQAQCPSCGERDTDEAPVVLRELVATVEELREQLTALQASAHPPAAGA